MAEKLTELNSKEMLGLRAALAFRAETDEVKNARANRDLDLLDKSLKQIKTLRLEIGRLKKSQREKKKVARDTQKVSALKLEIERLTKSQQKKKMLSSLGMILPWRLTCRDAKKTKWDIRAIQKARNVSQT